MNSKILLEFKDSEGRIIMGRGQAMLDLDYRWSANKRNRAVYRFLKKLREENLRFRDYEFIGFSWLDSPVQPDRADVPMTDFEPPAWVED